MTSLRSKPKKVIPESILAVLRAFSGEVVLSKDQVKLTKLLTQKSLKSLKQFLEEKDANIHTEDSNRETLLIKASRKGDPDIVRLLLEKNGKYINHVQHQGLSAVHCASKGGHLLCLDLLIKNGANTNIVNKEGLSALDFALDLVRKTNSKNAKMCFALLKLHETKPKIDEYVSLSEKIKRLTSQV